VVRAPYPSFSYPHVHEADVAAVAVAALLEDGHADATYTVSGPEPLSQLDQARVIGAAIGREVGFQELDAAATHELWEGWGYSPERSTTSCSSSASSPRHRPRRGGPSPTCWARWPGPSSSGPPNTPMRSADPAPGRCMSRNLLRVPGTPTRRAERTGSRG